MVLIYSIFNMVHILPDCQLSIECLYIILNMEQIHPVSYGQVLFHLNRQRYIPEGQFMEAVSPPSPWPSFAAGGHSTELQSNPCRRSLNVIYPGLFLH